jgi:FkbM family methyltransferase
LIPSNKDLGRMGRSDLLRLLEKAREREKQEAFQKLFKVGKAKLELAFPTLHHGFQVSSTHGPESQAPPAASSEPSHDSGSPPEPVGAVGLPAPVDDVRPRVGGDLDGGVHLHEEVMPKLFTQTVKAGNKERRVFYRQNVADDAAIRQIFGRKEYDLIGARFPGGTSFSRYRDLIDYAASMAPKRPLIVDAGANIGMASLYFAMTLPSPRILAIEPEASNVEVLTANLTDPLAGPVLDAQIFHGALASSSGAGTLIDPGNGSQSFRAVLGGDGQLPCVSINDIYAHRAPDTFPWIVKIDIEGAEAEVFSKNLEWIAETPLLIVELHDWLHPKKGTGTPFLRAIAALDRDFVYAGESVFSIANNMGAGR